MLPIGSSSRRLLNQSTHSSVAYSTASNDRHGPRRWMTSVLNRPITVSASALSYESPTLPTEGSMPASASRSLYLIETYWADSNGRRNTDFVDLRQPRVKCLCGRFPAQRLSRPGVEGGRHRRDLLSAVRTQIGAFREVLTQQSVGVLVGATLPRALRIAEVDLDARIDLEACMLRHFGSLIPCQ